MLNHLRRYYQQVLAQSLQEMAWFDLGLTEQPDAVQNSIDLLLKIDRQAEQPLPSGTTIVQVYDRANQELLILGEPGAGKSTLLLYLAQHLVIQAERDETGLLPVILPLSSWAAEQLSLTEWMSKQIAQTYSVPLKESRRWVQQGQILPLLDGLDEVKKEARPACIDAINTYHQTHFTPLVVCSRMAEYEALTRKQRLLLQTAVVVRPLTQVQVDAALRRVGEPMVGLRTALQEQPALRELAVSPLMLNILMLTYQGRTVRTESLTEVTLEQQIWMDYVQRMVNRRGDRKLFPLHTTVIWLSTLARYMRQHNETIFFSLGSLDLQPYTFPDRLLTFYRWSTGLVFGLLGGLLGGFYGGIIGMSLCGDTNWLIGALIGGLILGLVNGLIAGLKTTITLEGPGWATNTKYEDYQMVGNGFRWLLQRAILYLCLKCMRLLPWKVRYFLDDATDRCLLRRAGKGYSFMHHLLLNYFAGLDSSASSHSQVASHYIPPDP